ncbi:hypothetical protein FHW73_001857 [Luteimonas sp. RC10]|jgi:hypothetical protein|nr:hypothetical protein [Luteimonas sp. RC10]
MLRKREGGRRSLRECTMRFASPACGEADAPRASGGGMGFPGKSAPTPTLHP